MGFQALIPIFLGIISAWLINYLSDILPFTFRLSRPLCHKDGCDHVFSWGDYILLKPCKKCGNRSRARSLVVYVLVTLSALYLWMGHPPELIFIFSFLAFSYLFLVALIDLEHHLILMPLNIAGILILGVCGLVLNGWLSTVIGGLAGASIMFIFFLLGKVFTRIRSRRTGHKLESLEDSLAFGDVILSLLLGILLGWPLVWFGLLLGVLLSGLISLGVILTLVLVRKYKQHALNVFIPLGPAFILVAIVLVYFPALISVILS